MRFGPKTLGPLRHTWAPSTTLSLLRRCGAYAKQPKGKGPFGEKWVQRDGLLRTSCGARPLDAVGAPPVQGCLDGLDGY